MENNKLAELIFTDWTAACPHIEALSLQERDVLATHVIIEFGVRDPTEETGLAMGKFIRCLHFDPKVADESWKLAEKPLVPSHGNAPIAMWNTCSKLGLNHAIVLHKYVAKYFAWMLSQTSLGNTLPHFKMLPHKDYIPGTVLP